MLPSNQEIQNDIVFRAFANLDTSNIKILISAVESNNGDELDHIQLDTADKLKSLISVTSQSEFPLRKNQSLRNMYKPILIRSRWKILPWHKFPESLISDRNSKKKVARRDLRKMVEHLSEWMYLTLKNTSSKMTINVAAAITKAYPESFADTINGVIVDDARHVTLSNCLYTKIKNDKRIYKPKAPTSVTNDPEN